MEKNEVEEELAREVKENNEKIVHCLLELKAQREELMFLIQKQVEERKKLEMEMERLTYKLCLINKSMAQRIKAKQNYDATIEEIEEKYRKLRENSGDLMTMVTKDCHQLDSMINKKTSTEDTASVKEADAGTEISSTINTPKTSEEECICLPNKDGKCIREKMVSKMVQASPPVEAEVPTKLEKESSESKRKDSESKQENDERSVQTITTGEPESSTDEDDRAFEDQKSKLTRAATQYKETSLRRSQ